jgi:hypothetical protein
MNVAAGKINDLPICVNDNADTSLETDEPCDLVEIATEGVVFPV